MIKKVLRMISEYHCEWVTFIFVQLRDVVKNVKRIYKLLFLQYLPAFSNIDVNI